MAKISGIKKKQTLLDLFKKNLNQINFILIVILYLSLGAIFYLHH